MNFILQQGLDGCYFCSGVEMSVSSCGRGLLRNPCYTAYLLLGRACWTLRRRAIRQDRICLLISRQDKVECSVKLRLTSCMYYVLVHILSTCINALSSPFLGILWIPSVTAPMRLEETASNRAELKGAQVCHLSTQSETPCPASAKEESTGLYTSILGLVDRRWGKCTCTEAGWYSSPVYPPPWLQLRVSWILGTAALQQGSVISREEAGGRLKVQSAVVSGPQHLRSRQLNLMKRWGHRRKICWLIKQLRLLLGFCFCPSSLPLSESGHY